jgi:hypothetical protein
MEYIECPCSYKLPSSKPKLFLAGGITGCPDWQSDIVKELKECSVVIFNPRRRTFDVNDTSAREQITWEFDSMNVSDIILFWFPQETLCPIALYELGRYNVNSEDYSIVIGTHKDYIRREDVVIQTELATRNAVNKSGLTVHKSISECVTVVKQLINTF